jgi:tRNA 5-methylaminomethyl-2-thiouridine biosynthesis bifunctional protein
MPNDENHIKPANLSWDAAGNPYSEDYQDIYYSKANALAESSYIFLEANNFVERWNKLDGNNFIIAECGFGGGLNFLNTCKFWCESKPTNSTLYYLACELNPFNKSDLTRLHKQYPELSPYADCLIQDYPPLHSGIHSINLNFGNHHVVLILMLGNAKSMLEQVWQTYGFRIDAWYLDGFSPALNADMWDEELCSIIADLSKTGTTLSTYSAAGLIKNSLKQNNFSIKRKSGFAQKRHMLVAEYNPADKLQKKLQQGWFQLPETKYSNKSAIVIGGGLAGCSTASELAKTGWQITLIEREPKIASKASGNPRGIVYCKISDSPDDTADYYLASYLFALQHYQQISKTNSIDRQPCGLLQVAHDKREQKRQAQIMKKFKDTHFIENLNAQTASKLSGIELVNGGLFFPEGALLNPQALCQAYTLHNNINCITNTEVLKLTFKNKVWLVENTQGKIAQAPVVIIANSHDALNFKQTQHYPLLQNFGQIDEYPSTKLSSTLSCIICAKGYISPANAKKHFIGGITKSTEPMLSDIDEIVEQNLEFTRTINPQLTEELKKLGPSKSRSGSRCSSPDYLPITGPVENNISCRRIYKALNRNAKKKVSQTPEYVPGLYINVAHGSHGLTSTPIIANYLASLINHSPLPLSNASINCLLPLRFLIRDLKKQRL